MFDCVLGAWREHETELRRFLAGRCNDAALADDLLQDVFIKAMRQGEGFCRLDNPRAWLFRVARTTLIDHGRLERPVVELDDNLPAIPPDQRDEVDALDECLQRNLARLSAADRAIIEACDLAGRTVRDFAQAHDLGLPAAKARLLRARKRLREALVSHCRVHFDEAGNVCCHTPPD